MKQSIACSTPGYLYGIKFVAASVKSRPSVAPYVVLHRSPHVILCARAATHFAGDTHTSGGMFSFNCGPIYKCSSMDGVRGEGGEKRGWEVEIGRHELHLNH